MTARTRILLDTATAADCVDDVTFRTIMGALPSGVAVVTTLDDDGQPLGVTCSATCSVSQTPALLLVCLNNRSRVLKALLERGAFIVNVLQAHRETTSSLFASPITDRFTSVVWQPSRRGALPWLPFDTVAFAECRVVESIEAGDHHVVIGAIVDGGHTAEDRGALMYWRRQYGHWPVDDEPGLAAMTVAAEG
ncbi:flavin reductase family protein [Actinoplanes sp. NPDC004185]